MSSSELEFQNDMVNILEDGMTTSEWLRKFFTQCPKWNNGYWGNKFRNTQQTLKKNGCIYPMGPKTNYNWYRS